MLDMIWTKAACTVDSIVPIVRRLCGHLIRIGGRDRGTAGHWPFNRMSYQSVQQKRFGYFRNVQIIRSLERNMLELCCFCAALWCSSAEESINLIKSAILCRRNYSNNWAYNNTTQRCFVLRRFLMLLQMSSIMLRTRQLPVSASTIW